MQRSSFPIIVLILILSLLVTGCTGLFQRTPGHVATGTITGTVFGSQDHGGVAGIRVQVDGTDISAVTDENGDYILHGVPAGPRVLTVQYPGSAPHTMAAQVAGALLTLHMDGPEPVLMIGDEPVPWDTTVSSEPHVETMSVQVNVRANTSIELNVTLPTGGLDFAVPMELTPSLEQTLQAEVPTTVTMDVAYSVQSVTEAHVAVIYLSDTGDGESTVLAESVEAVNAGSSIVHFVHEIEPLAVPYVHVVVGLLDDQFRVLALSSMQGHRVTSDVLPIAPTLEVVGVAPGKVLLAWNGGNVTDFESYQIRRYNSTIKYPHYGDEIATVSDPSVTAFLDPIVPEGVTVYYRLFLKTEDGQTIGSNSVSVDVPHVGVRHMFIANDVGDIVLDPVQDVLYITDTDRNEVIVFSTVTDTELGRIRVGSRPTKMAITPGGETLYVVNSGGESITVVDLMTHGTQLIERFRSPVDVAVDAEGQRLYVSSWSRPGPSVFTVYDLKQGEVVAEVPFSERELGAWFLLLSHDGTRLIARSDGHSSPVLAFDTSDLTEAARIANRPVRVALLDPDGQHVFFDNTVHSVYDLAELGELPYHVRALSPSGDRLYSLDSHYYGSFFYNHNVFHTLERLSDEWVVTQRVDLLRDRNPTSDVVVTPDGSKAYLITYVSYNRNPMYLTIIDLDLRPIEVP